LRRIDGRLVIAGMLAVGGVFVVLNLMFAGGPKHVRVFASPTSGPVPRGSTQSVRLLSACAPVIDFDGGFWAPRGGWTLAPPIEPAFATLVSRDRVLLRLRSGQQLRLAHREPPIRLSRCTSPAP
jgi:hypothetical protein